MRYQRCGFSRLVTNQCAERNHRPRLITNVIFVDVRYRRTGHRICLHDYMKCTVICREIVDIDTPHIRLDCRENIRNIHSQLFTFFPIDRKIVIGRVGRIKTVCMGDRRILICLIDKSIDNFFKCMDIIVGIALFYLEAETDHRPYARNW